MNYGLRIEKVKKQISENKLDGFILTNPVNINYLIGSTNGGYLLITENKVVNLVGKLNEEDAKNEVGGICEVIGQKPLNLQVVSNVIKNENIKNLGFEANVLPYQSVMELKNFLGENVNLVPQNSVIEKFRMIKDNDEIERIKRAIQITEEVFDELLKFIKAGLSEIEVLDFIEHSFRNREVIKSAFDIAVISGKKTSLPHGKPSSKKIERGDFLTIDFGATYSSYRADMTRTIIIGEPTDEQKKIYETVLLAEQIAINHIINGGRSCWEADNLARKTIEKAGYGDYFIHSLGHGVGLETHESPNLSSNTNEILQTGVIITIEPGIYIPNWGGVRIEDMILITDYSAEVLTKSPRELIVISH